MKPAKVEITNPLMTPDVIKLINDHANYIREFLENVGADDIDAKIGAYKYYAEQGYLDYYRDAWVDHIDWLARTTYIHFHKHAREDDEAL